MVRRQEHRNVTHVEVETNTYLERKHRKLSYGQFKRQAEIQKVRDTSTEKGKRGRQKDKGGERLHKDS